LRADGTQLRQTAFESEIHEMIQWHASGDYVPPCCSGRNRKALFALQRFDGLKFN
jgi:hypothetical protein